MTPDCELLRRYAEDRSEESFDDLVARHLDLVYSVALRQVNGDTHLAQDVAQSVFSDLARKAAQLSSRTDLAGWLYTSAHFAATKAVRAESRRRTHEQEAQTMHDLATTTAPGQDWEKFRPVLDDAMHELNEADREALVLRYFQNSQHAVIGERLGINENAARMRVERALEKLRNHLSRRGITTTNAALSIVISAQAVQAAPVGLIVTISTNAALAGTTLAATASATATKAIAMTALQKTLVAITIIAGLTTPLVIQHQAHVKLREENQALRQQVGQLTAENTRFASGQSLTPQLPTPRMQVAASPAEPTTEELRTTSLIPKLLQLQAGDTPPKLTPDQIESYLQANGRNAASLLAAFRATGEQALLQEAMQKYPHDPQVTFAAVVEKNLSAEERRQRLEAFKHAAPQNALANYLSALDYFKSGQADQAVQELNAASGKQQFQDYSADFVQNDEEAWRAAGYSVAEAKTVASMSLMLPHLGEMKQLTQDMVSLANSYRQAGDEASAQAALQAALNLGHRLDGSPGQALITQLVGVAIQSIALRAMDPTSLYGGGNQTVQGRLDELAQQRSAITTLAAQFDTVQKQISDQDWISYKDRWRTFGEEAALRWAVGKYGQK